MFYNYLGLRGNSVNRDELTKIIFSHNSFITSVTLVEFLVYYKNERTYLKDVVGNLPYHFGYIDISYMSLEEHYQKYIETTNDEDLDTLISKAFELKIEQEAEKIQFFFYSISYIVAWIIFETNRLSKDEFVTAIDLRVLDYLQNSLRGNTKYIFENYKGYLKRAYESKEGPTKIIKNEFELDLKRISSFMVLMFHCAVRGVNLGDKDITFDGVIEKVYQDIENDVLLKKMKEQDLSLILKSKEYKSEADTLLNELIEEFRKRQALNEHPLVLEYFSIKMNKLLFHRAKFKVNDVSDMMLLYFLNTQGFSNSQVFLLTHDEELLDVLSKNGNKSREFMVSNNLERIKYEK